METTPAMFTDFTTMMETAWPYLMTLIFVGLIKSKL